VQGKGRDQILDGGERQTWAVLKYLGRFKGFYISSRDSNGFDRQRKKELKKKKRIRIRLGPFRMAYPLVPSHPWFRPYLFKISP
jgi:hypothetical protein